MNILFISPFVERGENHMSNNIIFSPGSFFHGTKADLNMGDFLVTGMKKNYNAKKETLQFHEVTSANSQSYSTSHCCSIQ